MFSVEVIADNSGKFCGNALTFATVELAEEYANDLYSRWTSVRAWRIMQSIPAGWGTVKVPVRMMEVA